MVGGVKASERNSIDPTYHAKDSEKSQKTANNQVKNSNNI
jgi:hypothetical protein